MEPEVDGLVRKLDEVAEWAAAHRVELTGEYLALIDAVEALPQNQSGADKSGRWLGSPDYAGALAREAIRLPDST